MNTNNVRTSKVSDSNSLDDILSGAEIGSKQDITPADIIDALAYNKNLEYKEFEDEADSGFTYGGDSRSEESFMRAYSNFDRLIDDMDYSEMSAFERYAEGHFMDGQQYHGFKKMSEADQRRTRVYDKFLDRSVLDKGIVVTRRATPQLLGFRSSERPTLAQLQKMKGKVVYSPANMSTGLAKTGLEIGSGYEKPVEYRIHIPGGSVGAGMWIGDHRINGWGGGQREFMTNRDSLYVIGDSREAKDFRGRDINVVDLYYIGRTKHKY